MLDPTRYSSIVLRPHQNNMAEDVRDGLTAKPKRLPSKYLYDEAGSIIYEKITQLPEYYLPRVEAAILRHHAPSMLEHCPNPLVLAELGGVSRVRTNILLDACFARQTELDYIAVDIASEAYEQAAPALLADYPRLRFVGMSGEFADGLDALREQAGPPRLLAFLGSTIGNMDDEELDVLLSQIRNCLRKNDRFLLGFDLPKDPDVLVPAYADSQGVTASFNHNLLIRLNRELNADFDVDCFTHRAVFNAKGSRIETYLVSNKDQTVWLADLDVELHFHRGETIHTENSHKRSVPTMQAFLDRHHFRVLGTFMDSRQWFCHLLFT